MYIYCNLSNSAFVYAVVNASSSICFILYTLVEFAFTSVVSNRICLTGCSYIYGFDLVYSASSSFVNVCISSFVSSLYKFIYPSSFTRFVAPSKYIPIFFVYGVMSIYLLSVVKNLSP